MKTQNTNNRTKQTTRNTTRQTQVRKPVQKTRITRQAKMPKGKLKIIPLGGLDEIG